MPLVSVIVPCYRQGEFLPQALQSALAQTIPDIEVIAIDDGSPEDPFAKLGEIASDTRLVLERQENKGLPLTRNRGIEMSKGSYLCFLDSDDWLAPEYLERLIDSLSKDARSAFSYCDVMEVFEGEGRHMARTPPFSVGKSRTVTSGDILPSLLCGGYFPPNTVLVRREVLEQVGGFAVGLGGHADYDLWLRITASGYEARYVDEKLAFYRVHGGNMSLRKQHMSDTRALALERLFSMFPGRAATALNEVMRTTAEEHTANQMLHTEVIRVGRELMETSSLLRDEKAKGENFFQETQSWIAKLMEAKEWHEGQSRYWQDEAARSLQLLKDQETWVQQLTEENERLRQQLSAIENE